MELSEWEQWLAGCNFYYLRTDQNFVCVKIGNQTTFSLIHGISFIEVLSALGHLLPWDPPSRIDIFIQAAFVPMGLPPLGGLIKFVKSEVLQGQTEIYLRSYTPHSRTSKYFIRSPQVAQKNILYQAGAVPITKKLVQGRVAQKLDLRSDDPNYRNTHRLYIAAAFALLHDKTNLGGNKKDYDIAAILVDKEGRVISYGLNRAKTNRLFHAEICCLASYFNNENRMIPDGCNLYVTMKPCLMCASYLAYYSKYAKDLRVYYAHTDPKAMDTDLEKNGIYIKRVDRSGRALKLVPTDDSKRQIKEEIFNVSHYLDTKITHRLVNNLRDYDWLYRYCNELLHRKEGKYAQDTDQVKPVEIALKNIHDFLSFIGLNDFSYDWRRLLNSD